MLQKKDGEYRSMGYGYFRLFELKQYLGVIFDDIRLLEPKAKCGYYTNTDTSQTIIDIFHPYNSRFYTPYAVNVGFESVYSHVYDDYVQNEYAVKVLKAAYHEQCHVFLDTKKYLKQNVSDRIKQVARVSVASKYLPEYYEQGYYRNPEEIMCELYALKEIEKFFDSHSVDFDWQGIILDQANYRYMFIEHADNFVDLKEQYLMKISSSFYDSRIDGRILNEINISKAAKELLKNGILLDVCNAQCGADEVDIINHYIGKYHPEYFRGYQCIKDEYIVPNIRNTCERISDIVLDIKPQDDLDDYDIDF